MNNYFLFLLGSRRSLGNAKMPLQFLVEFVILTHKTRFNKVYRNNNGLFYRQVLWTKLSTSRTNFDVALGDWTRYVLLLRRKRQGWATMVKNAKFFFFKQQYFSLFKMPTIFIIRTSNMNYKEIFHYAWRANILWIMLLPQILWGNLSTLMGMNDSDKKGGGWGHRCDLEG